VLDEDAGRYGGDRRQELSHDPVFELDEVGAPCLYKRAELRLELRRSSLRRPGRQPSKQCGPDLRTMPGAHDYSLPHVRDGHLLDDVACLGQLRVDAGFLGSFGSEERDLVPLRKAHD